MKKNFRRFVLTIYLLTLAAVSQAQVLKGTVSDAATGEVLIGASIQLKGTTSLNLIDVFVIGDTDYFIFYHDKECV